MSSEMKSQLTNFINSNPDKDMRYPTRDIRVEQQTNYENNLRCQEDTYIENCKKSTFNKQSFFNYAICCFNSNQLFLPPIKRIINNSLKMQENTGKDYNACQEFNTRDFNGNWTELYAQNELKRCMNARKQRMSSNTYDFRVQNHFNAIDYPKQDYQETKDVKDKTKDVVKSKKQQVRDNKESKVNSSKIQREKREKILEQGDVAMILNTAGDSVCIITLNELYEHKFNISKIDIQTAKYANSLRNKRVTTQRYPPSKITADIIRMSNYVLVSGGRIEYIFEGNFKSQIIKHWSNIIIGKNDDSDIEFDEESDNEDIEEIKDISSEEDEEEDIDDLMFHSSSRRSKDYEFKEKKTKKHSIDRKFNKNKKFSSNKEKYEPSYQYMQELLNKLLITYEPIQEDKETIEQEITDYVSKVPTEPMISFYKPTGQNDNDDDWTSDEEVETEPQGEEDLSLMKCLGLE